MQIFMIFVMSLVLVACGNTYSQIERSVHDSAIIGGVSVQKRTTMAERSVVYLKLLDKNDFPVSSCTGVLIGPQGVLTAAHCLGDNIVKVEVVYGDKQTTDTRFKRIATKFSKHPDFNTIPYETYEWKLDTYTNKYNKVEKILPGKNYDHDIGVIVFSGGPIEGTTWVDIDTDENRDYAGQKILIYGYGRTVDYGDEAKAKQSLVGSLKVGTFIIDSGFGDYDYMYWATGVDKTFSCQGDSGGPHFYERKGKLKIIGLSSCSSGTFAPDKKLSCQGRNKSARIAPFAEWIRSAEQALL